MNTKNAAIFAIDLPHSCKSPTRLHSFLLVWNGREFRNTVLFRSHKITQIQPQLTATNQPQARARLCLVFTSHRSSFSHPLHLQCCFPNTTSSLLFPVSLRPLRAFSFTSAHEEEASVPQAGKESVGARATVTGSTGDRRGGFPKESWVLACQSFWEAECRGLELPRPVPPPSSTRLRARARQHLASWPARLIAALASLPLDTASSLDSSFKGCKGKPEITWERNGASEDRPKERHSWRR